jgi:hypothetical protein
VKSQSSNTGKFHKNQTHSLKPTSRSLAARHRQKLKVEERKEEDRKTIINLLRHLKFNVTGTSKGLTVKDLVAFTGLTDRRVREALHSMPQGTLNKARGAFTGGWATGWEYSLKENQDVSAKPEEE